MADIFISYKKEDALLAQRVVALLRAEGRTVWWDDGITPHQAWDHMIEQEIEAARAVIVLWTPRSVASEWVRSEAHFAQERGKLVPVMIESCTLPIAFSLRQAIDLTGDLETDSPGWQKLRTWLDGMLGGEARPQAVAAAPAPAPPARPERAAAQRPRFARWHFAALAAVAVLALGSWGFYRSSAAAVQPDVVVDPFVLPAGGVLPAKFVDDLNDEMFATFSSSSRITPREGDGKRVPGAYQVGGRIDADSENVRFFLQVFAPDFSAPILTTRIERPRKEMKGLAHEMGFSLAEITRCIATASDSNGSAITTLPLEAAKAWAKYCSLPPDTPASGYVPVLRSVVAAAPDFANGWSNLSEVLWSMSGDPSTSNRSALLAEAREAAQKALDIDPVNAKAYMVQSQIALPRFDLSRSDSFPVFHDFAAWQKLADKSLSVRPSDCGCETSVYGTTLLVFGRIEAAIPYFEQEKAQVGGLSGDADKALALAIAGRSGEAKALLDKLATDWPTDQDVKGIRLSAAVWRRDWVEAQRVAADFPTFDGKEPLLAMLRAAASGDTAAVAAGGVRFTQLGASGGRAAWIAAEVMGLSGLDDEALALTEQIMTRDGALPAILLYAPGFEGARNTPRFAALINRTGLPRYWAMAGNAPDFCRPPGAPALCRSLAAR